MIHQFAKSFAVYDRNNIKIDSKKRRGISYVKHINHFVYF